MKCNNCQFEAPIQEWLMQEESGLMKVPEKTIKQYENFVDQQNTTETIKTFAKFMFRFLSEFGLMPYHKTVFICPKCGAKA